MQAKWRGISQALLNKRLTTRVYSKFDEIHLMFDEQSASRHSLGGGTMQNYTYKITLTLFFFFPTATFWWFSQTLLQTIWSSWVTEGCETKTT